jgi:hypothetical protein
MQTISLHDLLSIEVSDCRVFDVVGATIEGENLVVGHTTCGVDDRGCHGLSADAGPIRAVAASVARPRPDVVPGGAAALHPVLRRLALGPTS